MTVHIKNILLAIVALILIGISCYNFCFIRTLSPLELAHAQLLETALSSNSVWDQLFLNQNKIIKDKIVNLQNGRLCRNLKDLDTKNLTHRQISDKLKQFDYKCEVRPLAVNPRANKLSYLKIDRTTTNNPLDIGVAHQEVCRDQKQPECVIRIKRDGFPLNKRSQPHSTKAVLLDADGDPASYDNEAFKIGWAGQAIPKGPNHKFGLKKCPYRKYKERCESWVDAIMDEAHPTLIEPIGSDK